MLVQNFQHDVIYLFGRSRRYPIVTYCYPLLSHCFPSLIHSQSRRRRKGEDDRQWRRSQEALSVVDLIAGQEGEDFILDEGGVEEHEV